MRASRRLDPTSQIWLGGLVFIAAVALVLAGTGCYTASDDRGHSIPIALYPASEQVPTEPAQFAPPTSVLLIELGKGAPSSAVRTAVGGRTDLVGRLIPASGMTETTSWSWEGDDDDEMTLARLLAAARSAGADCLLIVGGTAEGLDRQTALGMLDLTVIGAYLVPSHIIRLESRCSAVAVDVATGRLLGTGTSEHRASLYVPSVTAEGVQDTRLEEILQEGRIAAVNALLDELATLGG